MIDNLREHVLGIVDAANRLRKKHSPHFEGSVSYCAIFCQDLDEYKDADTKAKSMGKEVKETSTGSLYLVPPIPTAAGELRIVKVRKPDPERPERGDADFSMENYSDFKQTFINDDHFNLIVRDDFEMIELVDPEFDVRAYFSNPPVEHHPGIKDALERADSPNN